MFHRKVEKKLAEDNQDVKGGKRHTAATLLIQEKKGYMQCNLTSLGWKYWSKSSSSSYVNRHSNKMVAIPENAKQFWSQVIKEESTK